MYPLSFILLLQQNFAFHRILTFLNAKHFRVETFLQLNYRHLNVLKICQDF